MNELWFNKSLFKDAYNGPYLETVVPWLSSQRVHLVGQAKHSGSIGDIPDTEVCSAYSHLWIFLNGELTSGPSTQNFSFEIHSLGLRDQFYKRVALLIIYENSLDFVLLHSNTSNLKWLLYRA